MHSSLVPSSHTLPGKKAGFGDKTRCIQFGLSDTVTACKPGLTVILISMVLIDYTGILKLAGTNNPLLPFRFVISHSPEK